MNVKNMRREADMKDHYELKNPRKNPYAERMRNGYTIIIDREPTISDEASETKSKTSDSHHSE